MSKNVNKNVIVTEVVADDTTSLNMNTPELQAAGEELRAKDGRGYFQGRVALAAKVSGKFAGIKGGGREEKAVEWGGETYVTSSRRNPGIRAFFRMKQNSVLFIPGEKYRVEVSLG